MSLQPAAAALASSFLLLAAADAAAPAPHAGSAPSAAEFIAARQAALDMSVQVVGMLERTANEGREPKNAGYAAASLAKWAKALPSLFPRGTVLGQTDVSTQAEPAVWTDRKGFEAAAATYAAATAELARRAQANDGPGFKAQLAEVKEACSACHASYKAGPK